MGRPYKQELDAIYETYHYAESFDTSALMPFFTYDNDRPMLIVGSGGSYAVAKMFELCYQSYGGFAKTITPYELQDEKYVIGRSKILIVTAGGSNPDTVGVYNYVRLYEPFSICVICMSEESKLSELIHHNKDALLFENSLPFGKDGYLAVNSSIAMFTIGIKLMASLESNEGDSLRTEERWPERNQVYEGMERCTNLVVLYGGWGKPAAVDLESKCSEAGLISVQCVDYRNFAHGRHNWMDKMHDGTGIVAISTPEDQVIRNKTLGKLPDDIPRFLLSTKRRGSLASLELLIQVFYLVDVLGEICGIDPGRPQVPDYGSQLYHIRYNLRTQDKYLKSILKSEKEYGVYRKMRGVRDAQLVKYCSELYDAFTVSLSSEKYGALVLDFDGTVIDDYHKSIPQFIVDKLNQLLAGDILVGFATGRGDSLTEILRTVIRKEYWNAVFVGYYNGSLINGLDAGYCPEVKKSEKLAEFGKLLEEHLPWLYDKLRCKDYQLSIREPDEQKLNLYFELLNEIKIYYGCSDVQICKSGHAVDIIEKGFGKQSLVNYIQKKQGYGVLCIGDEGRIFENDFEILLFNHGLSSDHQNILGKSGWNIAPPGLKKANAVRYYFEKFIIREGYFLMEGL